MSSVYCIQGSGDNPSPLTSKAMDCWPICNALPSCWDPQTFKISPTSLSFPHILSWPSSGRIWHYLKMAIIDDSQLSDWGIARTQSPTNKNYALKWSTFETIVGVNQPEVQWASLILEEPPSWSWLTSEPGKYAVSGKHMRYNWLSAKGSGWINCPEELMFIFMVPLRYRDVQLWKSDCLPWNNEHPLDRTS